MHSDTLTGPEFERWLFDREHRTLPDFLVMPEVAFGHGLQSGDIRALRWLAAHSAPPTPVPTHLLAALVRLHTAGIIERATTDLGAVYFTSPYSYEVLLHNVSYREKQT